MQSLINNYINGNLTTAKQQAKRHNATKLRLAFKEAGFSLAASVAIADFLKGRGTFQAACDAQHETA